MRADLLEKELDLNVSSSTPSAGFDTLAKGADFLKTGGQLILLEELNNLLSTEGAKVATLPAATATGDVMQAENTIRKRCI